jgi:hypothetical protein
MDGNVKSVSAAHWPVVVKNASRDIAVPRTPFKRAVENCTMRPEGVRAWLVNSSTGSKLMPQDNPRTENYRAEQQRAGNPRSERGESERSEQMRGENVRAGEVITEQLTQIGAKSVNAGLRMQAEMFDTFHAISRDWMTRATSEAELALKLPNRMSGVRSIPDAISTYQEWLGEMWSLCNEDSRRMVADGQRIMATGVRCLTGSAPPAAN